MKTKYVMISANPNEEIMGSMGRSKPHAFQPGINGKTPFELAIERNALISDKLMVIGQVSNFKYSRNAFLKLGIYNYEEIIEACSKNTAADFAFASFESKSDDILIVMDSFIPIQADDFYYNTLAHAKKMAAKGDIVLIDFYKDETLDPEEETKHPLHRIYCFKSDVYLDELMKFEPVVYYSVRRAHFKKSGSFINELLNELIPTKSVEDAVLKHSDCVKTIQASLPDLVSNQSDLKIKSQLSA